MKYLLPTILILSFCPLMMNCSSLQEIKPYKAPELSVDDLSYEDSAPDVLFDDKDKQTMAVADTPDVENAPLTPVKEEPVVAPVEAPVAAVDKDDTQDMIPAPVEHKTHKTVAPKSTRHPASFKNGFYKFSSDCMMKAKPDSGSADAGNVAAGKKLWLDSHNDQWLKAYKKAGTVYVPTQCIQ